MRRDDRRNASERRRGRFQPGIAPGSRRGRVARILAFRPESMIEAVGDAHLQKLEGRGQSLDFQMDEHFQHRQRARIGEIDDRPPLAVPPSADDQRSEEHTSELQSLMRISYAVFCLKKKNIQSKYNT